MAGRSSSKTSHLNSRRHNPSCGTQIPKRDLRVIFADFPVPRRPINRGLHFPYETDGVDRAEHPAH